MEYGTVQNAGWFLEHFVLQLLGLVIGVHDSDISLCQELVPFFFGMHSLPMKKLGRRRAGIN